MQLIRFFLDNFPSLQAILLGGVPALGWALAGLWIAGWLKRERNWKTGYTRKVFHFLTFMTVAFVQWRWGLSGVFLFGAATSLVIFYAILKGDGHLLYEAMAREKDAPHRTYYIISPYLSTLIGGIFSNLFFGPFAIFGYLVTGIGDAIGEPVGTRWGRHRYPVPSLKAVKSTRSYEGSAAVGISSCLVIALGLFLIPELTFDVHQSGKILLLGCAAMLIEAISPHGMDNATMQIFPSMLAGWLF